MKHVFQSKKIMLYITLLGIIIFNSSWQLPTQKNDTGNTQQMQSTPNADTTQPRNDADMGNINDMHDLDVQMKNLDQQMKKIGFDKIGKETDAAIENIDWKKIDNLVEKSIQETKNQMEKINFEEVGKQVTSAMKSIDWKQMQNNIAASVKVAQDEIENVDTKEIQQKLTELQAKINSDEFKQKVNLSVDKAMQAAEISIQHSNLEMQNQQDFSAALRKDGLIENSKKYSIQLKNGILFINGKKQSKVISENYKKYYQGRENFTITLNEEIDN